MRNIQCILTGEQIQLSEYHTKLIKQAVKDNGAPIRAEICLSLPESSKMRRWVMGSLIPLIIYYDGNDYKDSEVHERYFQFLKAELAPVAMKVNGKVHVFGQSTKGSKALGKFAEKLLDFLHENYGVSYDCKAVSPEFFKEWRDTMMSSSTEDFLGYCERLKIINKDKEI